MDVRVPDAIRPYTDKYFIRTRKILEHLDYDPTVSLKVFSRGTGEVKDLDEIFGQLFGKHRPNFDGEVWVREDGRYSGKDDPLAVLRGSAQDLVELETIYLGMVSRQLTKLNCPAVDFDYEYVEAYKTMDEVTDVFNEVDVPVLYFGARHYHWSRDRKLAKAALDAGAVQTATDVGSEIIGERGVGTTPHFLTILLAANSSKEFATVKTAEYFDRVMDPGIPNTTLVDTFNGEISDSLGICHQMEQQYGNRWNHKFRVDTCGENRMFESDPLADEVRRKYYDHSDFPDSVTESHYFTGKGVRVLPLANYRKHLIEKGFGENTEIVLSSGFGNVEKARTFVEAAKIFNEKEDYDLFSAVGVGSITDGRFATADVYEVDGAPFYKTGREVDEDLRERETLKRII